MHLTAATMLRSVAATSRSVLMARLLAPSLAQQIRLNSSDTATAAQTITPQPSAIVTGSFGGIGAAIAQTLAQDGYRVFAVDVKAATSPEADSNIVPITGDIASEQGVQDIYAKIAEHTAATADATTTATPDAAVLSAPRCLVNCAGILRDNMSLRMSADEFDQVINVNLRGTFLMSREFARMRVKADPSLAAAAPTAPNPPLPEHVTQDMSLFYTGSIVNISSIIGRVGNIGQANYASSKAGVLALTRTLAREYACLRLRVNAILPGLIKTDMTASIPDKVMKKIAKEVTLQRLGEPREIANVVSFLASDKSSYMTGATVEVTGGLMLG